MKNTRGRQNRAIANLDGSWPQSRQNLHKDYYAGCNKVNLSIMATSPKVNENFVETYLESITWDCIETSKKQKNQHTDKIFTQFCRTQAIQLKGIFSSWTETLWLHKCSGSSLTLDCFMQMRLSGHPWWLWRLFDLYRPRLSNLHIGCQTVVTACQSMPAISTRPNFHGNKFICKVRHEWRCLKRG